MSVLSKLFTEFRKELRLLLVVAIVSLLAISAIWHSYNKKIDMVEEKMKSVINGPK